MKKKIIMVILLVLFPLHVNATSGRISSSSIITCDGQTYGSHGDGHFHTAIQRGNYWYATGGPLVGNPCNNFNIATSDNHSISTTSKFIEISKSADTSLKEITINNSPIEIKDDIYYETSDASIVVNAIATDTKATVTYIKDKKLKLGNNSYEIKVNAEDNSIKIYHFNIYRLSKNNKATIKYNGKKVKFNKYKSDNIKVKKETKNITFEVFLKDKQAVSDVKKQYKLKKGNNKINITITAENGDKQKYTINVYRKKGIFF